MRVSTSAFAGRRPKSLVLLVTTIFLLFLISCESTHHLMSIHSDINEEFVVGGQPVQISEQNDISVAVIATDRKSVV